MVVGYSSFHCYIYSGTPLPLGYIVTVLISGVSLIQGSFVQNYHNWDKNKCPGVFISGVSALRGSTV